MVKYYLMNCTNCGTYLNIKSPDYICPKCGEVVDIFRYHPELIRKRKSKPQKLVYEREYYKKYRKKGLHKGKRINRLSTSYRRRYNKWRRDLKKKRRDKK